MGSGRGYPHDQPARAHVWCTCLPAFGNLEPAPGIQSVINFELVGQVLGVFWETQAVADSDGL